MSRRTACGRICLYRKKINISSVLAGQRLGIKEVDEGIWLVTIKPLSTQHENRISVREAFGDISPGTST